MTNRNILFLILVAVALLPYTAALTVDVSDCGSSTTVNEQYTCDVTTDQDDNVNYSITTSLQDSTDSPQSEAEINKSTGVVSWTPTTDGMYTLTVNATNGTAHNESSFEVEVQPESLGRLTLSNINLGSLDQNDIDQIRGQQLELTVPFNNTGGTTVSDIRVSTSGINQDYNVRVSTQDTQLQAGESGNILVEYTIPEDQDSGSESISGNVEVSGNLSSGESVSDTATLTAQAPSALRLVDDEIEVEVESDDDALEDGDTHDTDAELGDEITVIITVENLFEEIDVEDLEVSLDSTDLDTADGLDQDVDIDADDEEEIEFTFRLDEEDVDPSDAPFEISIEFDNAEDENGAQHDLEDFTFEIDMDVDDEDLRILDSSIGTYRLSCNTNRVEFDARIRNVGEDDLEEAMVQFEVDELDVSEFIRNLEVDEGDAEDVSTSHRFDQRPNSGEYIVDITAYTEQSTNSDTDRESTTLVVDDCATEEESDTDNGDNGNNDESEEDNEPIVVERPPANGNTQVPGTPVVSQPGQPIEDSTDNTFVYVLAGLVGVLIVTTGWVITRVLE